MSRSFAAVDRAERSQRRLDRLTGLLHAVHEGVLLGLLSPASLDELDRRYYEREVMYSTEAWNTSGLQTWESAAIGRWFPANGRVLVLAAGGGREALALERLGYRVDAAEPAAHLVERANAILESAGAMTRVEPIARDGVPTDGRWDAVVVGWSAYTLIRGSAARVRFLSAIRSVCAPGAPILLSFFERPEPSRPHTLAATLGRWVAGVRRRSGPVELGDRLQPNYVHHFGLAELRAEIRAAGCEMVAHASRPYGHAVVRVPEPGLPTAVRVDPIAGTDTLGRLEPPDGPDVLSHLEIALGSPQGPDPRVTPWEGLERATSLRAAVEAELLTAFARPPVFVAFSGGRDSSVLLALATELARREGLPAPVPLTQRIPWAEGSREDEWQDQLVRHLGLTEWVVVDVDDELDLLGPHSMPVVRQWGASWPPQASQVVALAGHAAGGTFVGGFLGDEIGSLWPPSQRRARDILDRRTRPRPSDARRVLLAGAPLEVRRATLALVNRSDLPWLNGRGRRASARSQAREVARYYGDWRLGIEDLWSSRHRSLLVSGMTRLVEACGSRFVAPFASGPVMRTLVSEIDDLRGPAAWGDVHSMIAGDALPQRWSRRRDKAHFQEALRGPLTQRLLGGWDGTGLDNPFVDAELLRREWSAGRIDARSTLLVASVVDRLVS